MRRGLLWSVLLVAILPGIAASADEIRRRFIMNASEDGVLMPELFEFWEVTASLHGAHPSVSLTVVAVASVEESGEPQSHVFTFRHDSSEVVAIGPRTYRVPMNGRLGPCSGLEVVLRLSPSTDDIADMSGSMRAGSKCQAMRTFSTDKQSKRKALPPIWNPSWSHP